MRVRDQRLIGALLLAYFALVTSLPILGHGLTLLGSSGVLNGSSFGLSKTVYDSVVSYPKIVIHSIVRRGDVSPSGYELKVNSIAFVVPAFLSFTIRMFNRIVIQRQVQAEDYGMIATMLLYIGLLIFINVSAHYATNLYPPGERDSILSNLQEIENRIFGSKIVIGLEQCMLFVTWGVKFCIWGFLRRCCRGVKEYVVALYVLLAYILIGLVVIEIAYYGAFCQPFSQYWAVPVQNDQCATYANYSIMQATLNISSDVALIVIPLVMVYGSHFSKSQKIILTCVFLLAGFTIIGAVLNKYFNFKSPFTTTYQLWYLREASIAVCVGNLICTWQLFMKIFPKLKAFHRHVNANPSAVVPQVNGSAPPTQYTIGGTPRLADGTPNLLGRKRGIWGKLKPRDPNASLFSTFRSGGSRTHSRNGNDDNENGHTNFDNGIELDPPAGPGAGSYPDDKAGKHGIGITVTDRSGAGNDNA